MERHGGLTQPPNEDGQDCRYHPNQQPRLTLPPNEDGLQISSRQQHSLEALMPQKLGAGSLRVLLVHQQWCRRHSCPHGLP